MAEEINRQSALAKAARAADKALREAHKDEWNKHMKSAAAQEGVADWTPPLTAEERAEKQIADLLAKNPGLASKYGQPVKS